MPEQHVDPEEAFKKAISDPGFEAYVGNVGRGLAGAVGQADIGIALAGKSIDRNRVDGFMNLVHPDSTGEGRAGFVKALTDIQDTRHRHDVFNELYGALPQNTKDAIGDPASILDSIDNLADPAKQADLNKGIATKKAWVDQQLAGSPELKGTGTLIGGLPEPVRTSLTPWRHWFQGELGQLSGPVPWEHKCTPPTWIGLPRSIPIGQARKSARKRPRVPS